MPVGFWMPVPKLQSIERKAKRGWTCYQRISPAVSLSVEESVFQCGETLAVTETYIQRCKSEKGVQRKGTCAYQPSSQGRPIYHPEVVPVQPLKRFFFLCSETVRAGECYGFRGQLTITVHHNVIPSHYYCGIDTANREVMSPSAAQETHWHVARVVSRPSSIGGLGPAVGLEVVWCRVEKGIKRRKAQPCDEKGALLIPNVTDALQKHLRYPDPAASNERTPRGRKSEVVR
ncbi:hypothetical protein DFP72DRAFT_849393 [Ephemerocybe angulata]|uniref:Uncharacterized protein n=1 Tax=Ephemerocybe angulata TaxID=980116 RepID=A0A8H6HUD4_9AGAR|nr:hypothetical protein DFP72DRAFT_849393 [Tulosesus angulatus]